MKAGRTCLKYSLKARPAADGVELDERGPGDARLSVFGSSVARNGKLDPADLDNGLDVDEYDDGGTGNLTGTVSGSTSEFRGRQYRGNTVGAGVVFTVL